MRWLLVIGWILICGAGQATSIKIGVYDGFPIKSASFMSLGGSFILEGESQQLNIKANQTATIFISGKSIVIKSGGVSINCGEKLMLLSEESNNHFRLKPNISEKKSRQYFDNLIVKWRNGILVFINETNLDRYVGGVVEAEMGAQHTKELYKAQAIISRTYALANKHKHEHQGFHLCDRVHCQAFHGRARHNDDILFAAYETQNLVLVDSDINLITAAFHSNCGGQTLSSEKVWSKPLPYLKSVKDTFCLVMSQSHWEKTISKEKWLSYLKKNGQTASGDSTSTIMSWYPGEKQEHFLGNENNLRMVDVRKDLKLRSAWFTIQEEGDEVNFIGRGFGHGVGLCQEGAIRRAQLGHSFEDILHHYYYDVHLMDMRKLDFFKD